MGLFASAELIKKKKMEEKDKEKKYGQMELIEIIE